MNIRILALTAFISLAVGAALDRYLSPPLVKTQETSKETTKNNIETVIKVVRQANGTEESTTTIIDHTVSKVADSKVTEAPAPRKNLNVSALVGNDFSRGVFKVVYGVSVSKEVLGPVTVGIYGLTSGTVGVSIGLNF